MSFRSGAGQTTPSGWGISAAHLCMGTGVEPGSVKGAASPRTPTWAYSLALVLTCLLFCVHDGFDDDSRPIKPIYQATSPQLVVL